MFYPAQNRRGLVGHWKYHGNVSASGTWYDISGNGNNGTLVDNAFVDGSGVNLDGSGDYVNCGSNSITTETNITWSCDVDFANVTTYKAIMGGTNGSSLPYRSLVVTGGQIEIAWSGSYANYRVYLSDSVVVTTSGYYNIAFTQSGTSAPILYINGQSVPVSLSASAGSESLPTGNIYFAIGSLGLYPGTTFNINAKIDDIRTYNRALSASEISQLYYQTKGRYV